MLNQPTGWDAALDGDTAMDWTDSDPIEPLLSKFATTGDANYGGISNARIDQIGQQLEASQDQGHTAALLDEAQRIIVEQQAYLIVVTYKRDPVVASPAFRSYVVPHAALLWTDAYA
jgi:ABC-type transport system substrate-binding protein